MKPMGRLWRTLLALALIAVLAADFLGPKKEVEHLWDHKTFFAIYGFVGCVAIILVAKAVGAAGLLRPEDHYDPFRAPQPGSGTEGDDRG